MMREQARTPTHRWRNPGSGDLRTRRKRQSRRRLSARLRNPRPGRNRRPVRGWKDRVISVVAPHPHTAQMFVAGLLLAAVVLLLR